MVINWHHELEYGMFCRAAARPLNIVAISMGRHRFSASPMGCYLRRDLSLRLVAALGCQARPQSCPPSISLKRGAQCSPIGRPVAHGTRHKRLIAQGREVLLSPETSPVNLLERRPVSSVFARMATILGQR